MMVYSRQKIEDDDIQAVVEALKSDMLTCGNRVVDFESALCELTGAKYAVVMNSATSALHAGYIALGVGPGDEVITTPITFAATANAAIMCGARIKFADVLLNGNINPASIKELISDKTKVITAVDFGGYPVDMDAIKALIKEQDIKIIDDASHALGSSINGKMVGTLADATIFSFHAIKPITTFEGGALLTNDENIAKSARLTRSHGMVKKQAWNMDMVTLGYNYRLSDVACALGLSQIKKLDKFINRRYEIAKIYDDAFKNSKYLKTIDIPDNIRSARHLYPVLLNSNLWCVKEDIYNELHAMGIGVQVHYKPTYQFSFYKNLYGEMRLDGAEDFYRAELSLPCHQMMSDDDAKFVIANLNELLEIYTSKSVCG
ncbi:spore coat polysaccharide biosynthesis protein SpsC [Campylobacter devanensis]|uniref:UDP-4-amino-4,6-dideoxy-N-acetyl-beta-L-altrosamine transaminase n=3 Tax=Campylobacter devanensis TaxID=3161138 RepID=A0A1X9STX8_9BACT|nr:UDP-4-amino-4,6-dideoxy-N-acetyl-beta-L-altrosamine transaminase [Campylobacter lanienae]ARQ99721.1 UDP-2-acetamido-2,6-dideoxy-beta-L-arabino-hex-4-ulose aminotransferase [Campylobacter lanienae]SUX02965.1 spore coat polysaccharide biosynthesis protein SpsC [Campylobacter lanienae]